MQTILRSRVRTIALVLAMHALAVGRSSAADPAELDTLKTQLRQLQEQFQKTVREQQQQIDSLTRQLDALTKSQSAAAEKRKLEEELAAELQPTATNKSPASVSGATAPSAAAAWSPAAPLQIQSGKSYLDIGLVGTFAAGFSSAHDVPTLELGGHDPNQRGFTVQGVEANFTGAVDPYFRGNANVLFQVDAAGDSNVELEEAWLETVSLPLSLQLRAGQILTEFGRQNATHPHAWAFVDAPIVLARLLGPDGLRNPGARLSWLVPTPFYSELFLSVQDSHGPTAYSFRNTSEISEPPSAYRLNENDHGVRGAQDLLFTPRYAASFDLTDNQVLLAGASAAFAPNAVGGPGNVSHSQVYGIDLTWKWKSPRQHAGFPFVAFQTEFLYRRLEAEAFDWDLDGNGSGGPGEIVSASNGLPASLGRETLYDYGFYSQLTYGFKKGWVAGLRLDAVDSNEAQYEKADLMLDGESLARDPSRAPRWRLSPNLTWYPSEFSKLRLQYNYDHRQSVGDDHSVWLQFEFLLGAHAAHKF